MTYKVITKGFMTTMASMLAVKKMLQAYYGTKSEKVIQLMDDLKECGECGDEVFYIYKMKGAN